MCLLAVCSKRHLTLDEFNNSWVANSDGVGFGYANSKSVFFKKGLMKKEEAWSEYLKVNIYPHVVHFRLASSGGIEPKLTHPYVMGSLNHEGGLVYKGEKSVLFHNGVVSNWLELLAILSLHGIKVEKPYNDTLILSVLLEKMKETGYNYTEILQQVGGKFVVMSAGSILRIGVFHELDGVWFSNDSYKPYIKKYYKNYYDYYDEDYYGEDYFENLKNKTTENKSLVLTSEGKKFI